MCHGHGEREEEGRLRKRSGWSSVRRQRLRRLRRASYAQAWASRPSLVGGMACAEERLKAAWTLQEAAFWQIQPPVSRFQINGLEFLHGRRMMVLAGTDEVSASERSRSGHPARGHMSG